MDQRGSSQIESLIKFANKVEKKKSSIDSRVRIKTNSETFAIPSYFECFYINNVSQIASYR